MGWDPLMGWDGMYSYGTRGGTWSGANRWVLVGVPQKGLIERPLVVPGLSVFLSMLAGSSYSSPSSSSTSFFFLSVIFL